MAYHYTSTRNPLSDKLYQLVSPSFGEAQLITEEHDKTRSLPGSVVKLTRVTHAVAERVGEGACVGGAGARRRRGACRVAPSPRHPAIDTGQRPRQRSATGALPTSLANLTHIQAAQHEYRGRPPANYDTQITVKYALFVCGSHQGARMLCFGKRLPFLSSE